MADEGPKIKDFATTPGSPTSEGSSEASTPLDEHTSESPNDPPRRLPSLRSVSDPRNINSNSTALGFLDNVRKPISSPSTFAAGSGTMDNSVFAKVRALQEQRKQKGLAPTPSNPASPMGNTNPVGVPNGFSPNMAIPPNLQRPGPPMHPRSAPNLPKPSLSERRANKMGLGMKLSNMGGGALSPGLQRPGAPKLSDAGVGPDLKSTQNGSSKQGSKMDDFKKYIDTDKGWITFDGAATITRTGVNFHNGQTFSISLDEVEILGELGKGNYGTVYKAKHAKPRVPRFGTGLSGLGRSQLAHTHSDPSPVWREGSNLSQEEPDDGTTGVTMAMKEIRLELDDAKFTTILRELVILHECVSPYIIDFYGAFFQEGAVYICIEYMDGGSIDKLYHGGIPENILRKITYSTVMGLKSLKDDHNIIHRDVKPTNILVNTKGQVKICDFGVSGNLVASIAKTNIGCQSYMAPERISGGQLAPTGNADGTYSVQSDIWSLGLTIIECATGHYPYPPEVSHTIFSQLSAIVEGDPPDLPESGFSDISKDFVKGCLNKVPKLRPTYAMLLNHPWLKPLTKPETITEEAEEGDEADQVADAVGNITLDSGTRDEEVAEWVKSVLERKNEGQGADGASPPALHKVNLDSVSPLASPAEQA